MKLSSKMKRGPAELELSTTSMIDVVFLLLIFFLVTATFVKPEREYRPSIKINEKNATASQNDLEPAIVDVVRRGSKIFYKIGGLEIDSDDALIATLKSFPNKEDGAFVRAADNVKFDFAVRAISACREAGFVGVSYVPMKNE